MLTQYLDEIERLEEIVQSECVSKGHLKHACKVLENLQCKLEKGTCDSMIINRCNSLFKLIDYKLGDIDRKGNTL